ncbi:MAG: protein kinase [Nannocystaceae bacterium]
MTALSAMESTPFGDKYVLVEHIATGGMAEIYRAEYSGIEGFAKELVIKRLRKEFASRTDVVTMFLDEARVAATLTHNNVVHTYDLGELAGEYYIAMELLKGEELVAVLRRAVKTGSMIPRLLGIGVVMQVLEGLHYVHTCTDSKGQPAGLVHRDVNPTNIHVGYDGVCKVVDFGIAATRATALQGTGQFAGKLSYMPPEQITGQPADQRSDIFALGVVLYEMCLGRRLFRGHPVEVRRRILDGDVPAPTFVDPSFPPALEAILVQALEVDPGERYQNCDHMFRDLEAFLRDGKQSCTPRNISAYMAEMFGEGAPAEVNYDDQYDDLVDEALDFDKYESLRPQAEHAAPDWVSSVEKKKKPRRRSHTMMIGSLRSLVDEVSAGESSAGESSAVVGKSTRSAFQASPAAAVVPTVGASSGSRATKPVFSVPSTFPMGGAIHAVPATAARSATYTKSSESSVHQLPAAPRPDSPGLASSPEGSSLEGSSPETSSSEAASFGAASTSALYASVRSRQPTGALHRVVGARTGGRRSLRATTGSVRSVRSRNLTGSRAGVRAPSSSGVRVAGARHRSAVDRAMTGSFAGGVMRDQAGKSPVVGWLFAITIFVIGVYFVYTMFIQALIQS